MPGETKVLGKDPSRYFWKHDRAGDLESRVKWNHEYRFRTNFESLGKPKNLYVFEIISKCLIKREDVNNFNWFLKTDSTLVYFRAVFLEVCLWNQWHQYLLRNLLEMQTLRAYFRPAGSETLRVGLAICVLTSPTGIKLPHLANKCIVYTVEWNFRLKNE